jgi:hypothetical protein
MERILPVGRLAFCPGPRMSGQPACQAGLLDRPARMQPAYLRSHMANCQLFNAAILQLVTTVVVSVLDLFLSGLWTSVGNQSGRLGPVI